MMRFLHAVLLLAVCSACGLFDNLGVACTTDFRFGLAVHVKDSSTGAWAASGARLLTYLQSTPVDTGTSFGTAYPPGRPDLDSMPLVGAGERPGTYRVIVRKPGYIDWVRTGVRVTSDECHVRQVELTALL